MRIAIDIDGVLNTLDSTVLEIYNEDSGDNLAPEDITEYHIENFVKPEYKENFYKYFLDKRVWQKIKVVEGCQEIIAKFIEEGNEIIFVTKTECENLVKKRNWLDRTFPFIGLDNLRRMLYSCPQKQYIIADILIDDGIFNLTGKRTYYSILFDKPYNQTSKNIPRLTRVHNWNEVYNAVKMVERLMKESPNENEPFMKGFTEYVKRRYLRK